MIINARQSRRQKFDNRTLPLATKRDCVRILSFSVFFSKAWGSSGGSFLEIKKWWMEKEGT